ncbi:MAG: hypothetical protein V3U54_04100 [Thermodesulfobacteriota bacterium]
MQRIAKKHGGKCLSDSYINNRIPLLWECSKGHQWKAVPDSVKNQGSWCQKCFNRRRGKSRRLTIEMMQEIAKQKGGECLSKRYKNARTRLKWRCAEGHVWKAVPDKIKNLGRWCRKCKPNKAGNKK